jgi:ATP-dependent helicase HrpB
MSCGEQFPVDTLKAAFLDAIDRSRVVLTSPTGSGKSTQVPRWCTAFGRVLVVEPRRVACLGLAAWVASLEQTPVGKVAGYAVRDDRRMNRETSIVFATPGTVLQWAADGKNLPFDTVVIDEFHERSLETDLVLALVKARFPGRTAVMSATVDADRVASYLDAAVLRAEGRLHPVTCRYIEDGALLPSAEMLDRRVLRAVDAAEKDPGDILVFLPGKGEINWIRNRLASSKHDVEVLEIHGGLCLADQARIFEPGRKRRIILATNAAETSITVPDIGTVIDSGLVKRTKYIKGRGFLTLCPVAEDSARQRAGRAGRVQKGMCYRLWSQRADLPRFTPPEIYRESLSEFVLSALACGARPEDLSFLDAPKPYALEAARAELSAVGAVDKAGNITARGRRLFGFPLPPALGSLLVEAEKQGCTADAADLVAALAPGRPIFIGPPPEDPEDNLRADGCDAAAMIRAVRFGKPRRHGLNPAALDEARAVRRRLGDVFSIPGDLPPDKTIDRPGLARAALRSDPTGAHAVRRRKGGIFLADGRSECLLSKDSAVDATKCEAVFVFQSSAVSKGYAKDRIYATCAMPLSFRRLAEAGIGKETVTDTFVEDKIAKAEISRIFAGCVLEVQKEIPKKEAAVQTLADLFLKKRIFPNAAADAEKTLRAAARARAISRLANAEPLDLGEWADKEALDVKDWVFERLEALGVESGEDLVFLTEQDLRVPGLPEPTADFLAEKFPETIRAGNAAYRAQYDFKAREVTLVLQEGPVDRTLSRNLLPSFSGFSVKLRHHSKIIVLK